MPLDDQLGAVFLVAVWVDWRVHHRTPPSSWEVSVVADNRPPLRYGKEPYLVDRDGKHRHFGTAVALAGAVRQVVEHPAVVLLPAEAVRLVLWS